MRHSPAMFALGFVATAAEIAVLGIVSATYPDDWPFVLTLGGMLVGAVNMAAARSVEIRTGAGGFYARGAGVALVPVACLTVSIAIVGGAPRLEAVAVVITVLAVVAIALGSVGVRMGRAARAVLDRRLRRCPGCEYSLEGLEGGLCPECGRENVYA